MFFIANTKPLDHVDFFSRVGLGRYIINLYKKLNNENKKKIYDVFLQCQNEISERYNLQFDSFQTDIILFLQKLCYLKFLKNDYKNNKHFFVKLLNKKNQQKSYTLDPTKPLRQKFLHKMISHLMLPLLMSNNKYFKEKDYFQIIDRPVFALHMTLNACLAIYDEYKAILIKKMKENNFDKIERLTCLFVLNHVFALCITNIFMNKKGQNSVEDIDIKQDNPIIKSYKDKFDIENPIINLFYKNSNSDFIESAINEIQKQNVQIDKIYAYKVYIVLGAKIPKDQIKNTYLNKNLLLELQKQESYFYIPDFHVTLGDFSNLIFQKYFSLIFTDQKRVFQFLYNKLSMLKNQIHNMKLPTENNLVFVYPLDHANVAYCIITNSLVELPEEYIKKTIILKNICQIIDTLIFENKDNLRLIKEILKIKYDC